MKDDSLGDVQSFMIIDGLEKVTDPWIVGKDDHWFVHNGKRLHKESWNAALDAVVNELAKVYPYSAKEIKVIMEQIK